MNGLKYIRTRCNFSLNELANILGVSRQILSAWETNKKHIPEKRLKQLSEYFGVDPKYFIEISDVEKQELLEKGMFRYYENGKQTYRYKPQDGIKSLDETRVFFLGDETETLDEKYIAAKKKKQAVLDKAEEIIRYYDKGGSVESLIVNINRGCGIYGGINSLLDEMPNKDLILRMTYFNSINNIILALLLAHGFMNKTEIHEKFNYCQGDPAYDDSNWIISLAEQFKAHWDSQNEAVMQKHLEYKENAKLEKKFHPHIEPLSDIANVLKKAEKEYKDFKIENPNVPISSTYITSTK